MPRAIEALKTLRAGQVISRDGPESHLAKEGTPTMGGLVLLAGLILSSSAVGLMVHVEGAVYGLRFGASGLAAVLMLIAGYGLLGFLDDYLIISRGKALGLKARQKLAGQSILAIAFVAWLAYIGRDSVYPTSVRLPFGRFIELGSIYYAFAVLFIVGMSNAVNLTDGLDGLVSGLSTQTAIFLAWGSALLIGASVAIDPALVIVCAATAGACLAFLWFNAHPAKVFMGDTGSLALGAGFAAVAILSKQEFALLFFGLVFVIEALSVIIQVISFKTTGKRVFRMSPIHHHFELAGWPEEKIVTRFWIAGLLACAAGVAVLGVARS
ncbi:MAG: phospho-N-acetylmuramoyl-pentapeptide-transferase [Armatimonadota bacterium]|nr:phospho-N-acetylmuramoyl-pentapeptide-transferase [Armatimonadota bacterium]